MSWRFAGRLTIVVHGSKNPSNLEWRSMINDESLRGYPENGRTLIVSYGGGPDGAQRELLGNRIRRKPVPTCIMTKSVMVRAIVATLQFFNRNMKVVGLDERQAAYDFLSLSGQEREAADRMRREMEGELGLTSEPTFDQRA